MADLSIDFVGLRFPNPFLLASAPPTRNAEMIKRAFAAGWGGAVTKSIAREPSRDLQPRLSALRHRKRNIGMENIELTTQLSVEQWQAEIAEVKSAYPDRPLIASIMDAPVEKHWQYLTCAMQEAGVDALELNVSCPHGMPARAMGAFIGQDPALTGQITAWVKKVATVPVIVKLTPNVTDIAPVARAARDHGADGLAAINTVLGLIGVDLDTFAPLPTVGGRGTYGGYSGPGVKPIALRCVAQMAKATGLPISGLGGVSTWQDAMEFILVGSSTVQVGTTVMWQGYDIVEDWRREMSDYLDRKGFAGVNQAVGLTLPRLVEFPEMSLEPRVVATVDDTCNGCLLCVTACADGGFQAISGEKGQIVHVDPDLCDGCGLCVMVCPLDSIKMINDQFATESCPLPGEGNG